MAVKTYARRIPVKSVLMAVLAVREAMLPYEGKTCLAVVEPPRDPRGLGMALGALDRAELVQVRVQVALAAQAVYPCIVCL